jgi:sirohydrochlorin cobaltochelatase
MTPPLRIILVLIFGLSPLVVQSLHVLNGHEFYRLVEEVRQSPIRASMGLPLLSSPDDYASVVQNFIHRFRDMKNQALVLVGHGTDNPIWSSYMALSHIFRERTGPNIYVGVVEGHPSKDRIINHIIDAGIKNVHLIPFMLVAGTHFQEDLAGEKDSWKSDLEENNISVSIETKGLGFNPEIIGIFCKHIEDALDVIPSGNKG